MENASQNVDKLLHSEAKDWPPILVVAAGEGKVQNGDAFGSDWEGSAGRVVQFLRWVRTEGNAQVLKGHKYWDRGNALAQKGAHGSGMTDSDN